MIWQQPDLEGDDCDSFPPELFNTIAVATHNRSFHCAYKIGHYIKGKDRPKVVRFQHVKDRDLVWHKSKDLSIGHYIRVMYPPVQRYNTRHILKKDHGQQSAMRNRRPR